MRKVHRAQSMPLFSDWGMGYSVDTPSVRAFQHRVVLYIIANTSQIGKSTIVKHIFVLPEARNYNIDNGDATYRYNLKVILKLYEYCQYRGGFSCFLF